MNKKLSNILLTGLIAIGLAACGNTSSPISSAQNSVPTSGNSNVASSSKVETSTNVPSSVITSTEESPIEYLRAEKESVILKVDEQAVLSNYYEIKGFKTLSTKQKKVTITSSDSNIISINKKFTAMTAVSVGTATITVTSDIDTSKTCTFEVVVEEAFFDRKLSFIDPSWDVTHESDPTNPYIKVNTNMDQGLFIRNSDGLKWYVETEVTVHNVFPGELWPKFGIVASTSNHCVEFVDNKLYFYLDGRMDYENKWTDFGFCEVLNGYNWAWNKGVDDTMARSSNQVYKNPTDIDYNVTFKMGMIRDGFDCHFFVNGQYGSSLKVLGTIFGNYNETTKDYTDPVNAMVGFFSFNSSITFSNYKYINDSAAVDALKPASPVYIEQFSKN